MILLLFTEANSLSAFYVYSTTMVGYSTLTGSFFNVLKIYMGDFSQVPAMYAVEPTFTIIYMWVLMTLYTIFIV